MSSGSTTALDFRLDLSQRFVASDDPSAAILLERYRFYIESQDGSLRYTDVAHESWTLSRRAAVETIAMDGPGVRATGRSTRRRP